ncbi:hypothetical protein ACQKCU_09560 [Heyndrickxia sporothermodurans]
MYASVATWRRLDLQLNNWPRQGIVWHLFVLIILIFST